MKRILNQFVTVSLILGLVVTVSCSSDDSGSTNSQNIEAVIATAQSGSWRITSYVEDGVDETSDFSGYAFTFNSDGSLTAVNGAITVNGTWSVDNDDSSNDIDFNIFFASPPDFEELTEDWDIVSRSNSRIQLRDVSGGDGSVDTLVFEKL
ncbi:hypothetical protein ACJD0Z_18440 [Flavobacteriaceae bacterium M23B6Z8]